MEDPNFVKVIEDLGKDTQTLVKHMADNRVMTALAVLLDVDIVVPKCRFGTLCSALSWGPGVVVLLFGKGSSRKFVWHFSPLIKCMIHCGTCYLLCMFIPIRI